MDQICGQYVFLLLTEAPLCTSLPNGAEAARRRIANEHANYDRHHAQHERYSSARKRCCFSGLAQTQSSDSLWNGASDLETGSVGMCLFNQEWYSRASNRIVDETLIQ